MTTGAERPDEMDHEKEHNNVVPKLVAPEPSPTRRRTSLCSRVWSQCDYGRACSSARQGRLAFTI